MRVCRDIAETFSSRTKSYTALEMSFLEVRCRKVDIGTYLFLIQEITPAIPLNMYAI